MPAESVSQLPSTAFIAMPDYTVNSFSTDQLAQLTSEQVDYLLSSAYYGKFSDNVVNALRSLSVNDPVVLVTGSNSMIQKGSAIFVVTMLSIWKIFI